MTDQVDQDLKRRRLVDEGKITVRESEEQADEWERVSVLFDNLLFFLGRILYVLVVLFVVLCIVYCVYISTTKADRTGQSFA